MPIQYQLQMPPSGYTLKHTFQGDVPELQRSEFISSEDGNLFIERLEGLSEMFRPVFNKLSIKESTIDNFLAIINSDGDSRVYINEIQFIATCKTSSNKSTSTTKKGDKIFKDDIADIGSVKLLDLNGDAIEVNSDAGIAFVFSQGWRKGFFYDYSVLYPNPRKRTIRLDLLYGKFFNRMLFQEMYSIRDEQWRNLFKWEWFPFIGLNHEERSRLIGFASQEDYPYGVLEEICTSFSSRIEMKIDKWKTFEYLNNHIGFISAAKNCYEVKNYIGCISILFPRIEGVLRQLFHEESLFEQPNQANLVSNLVENQFPYSTLLPQKFEQYLKEFYFGSFDLHEGRVPLTRNSIGHGFSKLDDYNAIRATLGFLILDQLYHYLTD